MHQMLKTEQERHPPAGGAGLDHQWDSVESDTESLAHDRVHLQQLQMCTGHHDQNEFILPPKENTDSLQWGGGEDDDDESEHQGIYDSLDVAAHYYAKSNSTLKPTDYLDVQTHEKEETGQLLTDDGLSDLRYDPNWRTNLRGAGSFRGSPQMSVEDYYPEEKSAQSHGDKQGLLIKGGYSYIVDTGPAVVVTPQMTGNESDQPYRLLSKDGQMSSVTSPQCPSHILQCRSPEANHSKPSCMFTKEDKSLLKRFRKECENNAELNELTNDMHAMHIQKYNPQNTQGKQRTMVCSKKMERLTEDIVERNKTTLGRNTSKCGSYVRVHALKQETPQSVKKVTQISKGKEAQREQPSSPPQQQQPPALGVKAEWEDCLSSMSTRPVAVTWPDPQKTTSSQPVLPAIHLNINLNTSSHLPPLIQQRGQDDIISLASPPGCPHWSPASEVQLALSPGCQPTNPEKSLQMCQKGVNAHAHHQNLEKSLRTPALKTPLSCKLEDQMCPNEVHTKKFPLNLIRTPTTSLSLGSGSYAVVPPIGKSMTGAELSPDVNTDYPIHRSSSDGYLVQMEKQKQLRARVTYKAYSLKDYKQLKSGINLGGLGADYTAIEKTKIKRQKLYSNVIREQNKKISRIPFLLAKDPEGNDKQVPRMKALEYAKTIVKPPVQSQPKQRQKRLDDSQLTTLEILRKRHEEEKQAVAIFRHLHAV